MKRLIIVACVGLIAALCLAAAIERAPIPAVSDRSGPGAVPVGKLVVHEWGTFTGFAGSDGVHLPFDTIVSSDLPAFVMNRQKQAIRMDPKLRVPLLFQKGGGIAALQRMETPVIYFYADAPKEVNVRVDFPQGTLTEFYPPVRSMGPRYGMGFGELLIREPAPATLPSAGAEAHAAESFLDWGSVRIVPRPSGNEGKLISVVADDSRYSFARHADANLVQFADADGPRHEEKFLFYRGLGNFTLPVRLIALGGDHYELKNASGSPIAAAFLIEIGGDAHKTARFGRFEKSGANERLTLPSTRRTQDELAAEISRSLIADGLYEKEALAMVETWKSTWLDEPGTRLLYIVPRPVTDALLPLHVSPTPNQTVRVLVGRIDILTPEREARLQSMMLTATATANLSDDDARMLTDLGRFLAPTLGRVGKLAGDVERRHAGLLYGAFYRSQTDRK